MTTSDWAINAAHRHSIRDQLVQFASMSHPGARCIVLWPDDVVSVHILDNGGRLRDLAHHSVDMIEVLQERYPMLQVGQVVYLNEINGGHTIRNNFNQDLSDFFAGRNMLALKECL